MKELIGTESSIMNGSRYKNREFRNAKVDEGNILIRDLLFNNNFYKLY